MAMGIKNVWIGETLVPEDGASMNRRAWGFYAVLSREWTYMCVF